MYITVITILRVLHIVGSVAWIGGGMFLVNVVFPTVKEAGPDGGKFMQAVGRSGRLSRLFAISAVTTFLSGLVLYGMMRYDRALMTGSLAAITLTIGAGLGLLAFLHGIFGSGAAANRSAALAKEIAARNAPPTPEQVQLGQTLAGENMRHGMISMVLGGLALLFMAAAQTI
ncbi:MAG: hypothetical protein IT317_05845 [Anaerolineales bacterium]|nr:hypothetical protein [Anaerolineales bacterium]